MKGLYSALLISFDENGNLDEKGTRNIVRYNIDVMKVDGLYVGGSTGENFMISTEMKKRIFEIVKDEAKDQIKLIAQVGSINLYEAVELGKYATDLGYDSLSAVTPFYYKFDFEEIKNYYMTIVNETNNNMIIYSIPFLTGVNMNVEQFGELLCHDKIIGIKFTAGDFYLLERVRKAFPNKLIYAGFDEMLLPAVALGVDGAIGSTYNVTGKIAREVFEATKAGDLALARERQTHLNDIIEDILKNGLYQTIKEILKSKGVDAIGYCRLPMKKISAEKVEIAKQIGTKIN
ncbi:N-acetylneuraminate lyase [Cetobacterium sp. 8H]|uniref:N-acetylneuraminate lyase n=1 Tax=Cetobacterium sp. 8H TaxID=2759681 RepID=UPI00163C1F05|nr:N-acetylneuraminate lyase [Cetobacterium sp. 8H]MBC2850256.1 N-acetylneuraminate lyase [Cetobacterium sp. 8H]